MQIKADPVTLQFEAHSYNLYVCKKNRCVFYTVFDCYLCQNNICPAFAFDTIV